jgi:hypothetical protein
VKEKVTSGFVIATKQDESEPDILVDELHPCVCPNCGISKFEEGHEKDIITNEEIKSLKTRCWGGFGIARYRFLPHKCKACDTVFAPWKVEKKANVSVIGGCIGLIFSLAFIIIPLMLTVMCDNLLMIPAAVIMLCFSAVCIAWIHIETAKDIDIEKEIADFLKYEDITDEYLDPDEDDDAEEETEDLNVTFGVNTQQAASACKDLATQNMSEPKSAMEVFDTLTPEQKAVAYYLMGNAAERMNGMMNDVWRVDL